MSALPFVMIAVVLSLGACTEPGPAPSGSKPNASPASPPAPERQGPAGGKAENEQPAGKLVDVEIIVGSNGELKERCAKGGPSVNVFVESSTLVYHCIGGQLQNHTAAHADPPEKDPTIVHVSTGERIRWYSNTHEFKVLSVLKPKDPKLGPRHPDAPDEPFAAFPTTYSKAVESSPVPQINGEAVVTQRYKATFDILKVGVVDPDTICSM